MENIPAASTTPTPEITKDAKLFAMLCHLGALAGFLFPFGNILGPLIFWLIRKNESAFVNDQGKESLNFQITVTIAALICVPLMFIIIGLPLLIIVGIAALIFTVIAAIKANEGVAYRYPWALRLIK
ncbi:MAG: DUF4870 domain-containing protein [Opitutaceae bacterium]